MARAPEIPVALRAQAELERRRRLRARSAEEVERLVVVMPELDPLPDPPAEDMALDGAEALTVTRGARLGALLEEWRRKREQGG